MNKQTYPTIIADYREERSGIPNLLQERACDVKLRELKTGDYIINNQVVIERKTNDDFVVSLMQDRLFRQCYKLRKSAYIPGLLIEGNPYSTRHDISREAIRGTLLSISLAWQIPINYTSNPEDTADMILMIAQQKHKEQHVIPRHGYKPKTLRKQQVYFLQGLPTVGAKLAEELLKHFGSVQQVLSANEKSLLEIHGIGKERVRRIRGFLEG